MRSASRDLKWQRRVAELYLDFSRIQRRVEQRTAGRFRDAGLDDVTPQQSYALMVLFQAKEPMTARLLAGEMSLSEVTVGRFVHALEKNRWVTRRPHPDDARAALIYLTKKAYDALPAFVSIYNDNSDALFRGFAREEVEHLAAHLERVRANLELSE